MLTNGKLTFGHADAEQGEHKSDQKVDSHFEVCNAPNFLFRRKAATTFFWVLSSPVASDELGACAARSTGIYSPTAFDEKRKFGFFSSGRAVRERLVVMIRPSVSIERERA